MSDHGEGQSVSQLRDESRSATYRFPGLSEILLLRRWRRMMSSFSTRGRDRSDQIGGGVYSEAGGEKERECVCGGVCVCSTR